MDLSLFNYDLPEGYIAYNPTRRRDSAKMMVLDRQSGDIKHQKIPAIIDYFKPGDGLVINNTRVFKARLLLRRPTGGKVEIFLLNEINYKGRICWEVLTHPGRRVKEGEILFFDDLLSMEVMRKQPNEKTIIRFKSRKEADWIIDKFGHVPLPVYIHRPDDKIDESRYQTVYAHPKKSGAVAAPTAGLHFTERILKNIEKAGVKIIPITLHVGFGTFKAVRVDDINKHSVDPEFAEISKSSANTINRIKKNGGRIFAVGTTSVRTLEAAPCSNGLIQSFSDFVDLYIKPGHEFKIVDKMLTNFHLPKSSLVILVSAFAGREQIIKSYETAIKEKYRFYSYGDCMLIL